MKIIMSVLSIILLVCGFPSVATADDCRPYFERIFSASADTQFEVHGTRIYYEGGNPTRRYFSILLGQDTQVTSDENDHFIMRKRTDVDAASPPILGEFWEARSDQMRSNGSGRRELSLRRGTNGKIDLFVKSGSAVSNGSNGSLIATSCYSINDNTEQFAIKGGYSNGSWVYNEWLFSIESLN